MGSLADLGPMDEVEPVAVPLLPAPGRPPVRLAPNYSSAHMTTPYHTSPYHTTPYHTTSQHTPPHPTPPPAPPLPEHGGLPRHTILLPDGITEHRAQIWARARTHPLDLPVALQFLQSPLPPCADLVAGPLAVHQPPVVPRRHHQVEVAAVLATEKCIQNSLENFNVKHLNKMANI